MIWAAFTVFAAFMQSFRNAFQSSLSQHVTTSGVTLARFIWAGPLAGLYLLALYQWQPVAIPTPSTSTFSYIIGAAIMQILATGLMVRIFKEKNYAIGVGLAKSEAIIAAVFGVWFFSTTLTPLGWIGVFLGGIAVFLLSSATSLKHLSLSTVCYGVGSGAAFALTSLWVREASLSLHLPFPYSAAWVLLAVISLQTCLLVGYLLLRDRHTLVALMAHSKLTIATSVASCLGSIGWFSAMSLESVPYVKTVGQIEVLFTLLISFFWFNERLKRSDILGLALIVIAAILVIWA